jgi:MinD superfamily P-loop ATPase
VCINKWDLNPEISQRIADDCSREQIALVGGIPYDRVVSEALVRRKIVLEHDPQCAVAREIRNVWENLAALAEGREQSVEATARGARSAYHG